MLKPALLMSTSNVAVVFDDRVDGRRDGVEVGYVDLAEVETVAQVRRLGSFFKATHASQLRMAATTE